VDTNITWQPSHFSPWMKYLVVTSVLAVLYVVTARLGLLLALPPDVKVPAVWPPSGIALAGVLLLRYRVWPGIWLGAFIGNLWDFFQAPGQAPLSSHLLLSSGIAVGSTLQPLVGAYLINRLMGGQNLLDSAGNVFRFVMVSLLMCLVASTIGVTFFLSAGFTTWANLGFNWMTWWLGDLIGVLVVTPLVLTWHRLPDFLVAPRRLAEAGPLLVVLLSVGLLNFGVWGPEGIDNGYLLYMTVPPLLWAVLRFGQHGATAALLLVSGIAVWGTSQHHGPWAMQTLNESFMPLQTFLGVLTLTSLALVGVLTERQRGVAALQESTERLHLAQEAGHIGVWDWNVLTGQLHWDGVETIHGLEAGSFGGSFEDYLQDVHSQDRDVVIKAVNQAIEQGGELDQQYRVVWDDGSIHWVHSKGRAFQDEQGRTVRLAGTCQDITRRKESDEAKVASEERFRSLIEHSYDAIAVVDHEGVFAYASPSVRTILGFAPEELLGTNGFNLVHPDELPEARGAFAQILQAPDNRAEVRVRAHRADGSWPWLEVSIMNLLHHPAVDGVVVNFRDITERKQQKSRPGKPCEGKCSLKKRFTTGSKTTSRWSIRCCTWSPSEYQTKQLRRYCGTARAESRPSPWCMKSYTGLKT
jgi:PAS domain S-box-containing protein